MKKRVLLLIAALAIALACLSAEGSDYKKPVLVKSIGFTAKYVDGKVVCAWKKYLRDDLQYYKVVRSDSNPNPVYPDDGYVFYTQDKTVTKYEDPAPGAGKYFYRLTIVTNKGDRWVSEVVAVKVPEAQSSVPTDKDFAQ
jgi:hypothetical protein